MSQDLHTKPLLAQTLWHSSKSQTSRQLSGGAFPGLRDGLPGGRQGLDLPLECAGLESPHLLGQVFSAHTGLSEITGVATGMWDEQRRCRGQGCGASNIPLRHKQRKGLSQRSLRGLSGGRSSDVPEAKRGRNTQESITNGTGNSGKRSTGFRSRRLVLFSMECFHYSGWGWEPDCGSLERLGSGDEECRQVF